MRSFETYLSEKRLRSGGGLFAGNIHRSRHWEKPCYVYEIVIHLVCVDSTICLTKNNCVVNVKSCF